MGAVRRQGLPPSPEGAKAWARGLQGPASLLTSKISCHFLEETYPTRWKQLSTKSKQQRTESTHLQGPGGEAGRCLRQGRTKLLKWMVLSYKVA